MSHQLGDDVRHRAFADSRSRKTPSAGFMSVLTAFFASLVLTWPAQPADAEGAGTAHDASAPMAAQAAEDPMAVWERLARRFRNDEAAQVRIERHIILRVTPMPGPTRENLMAIAPTAPSAPRMVERKMGDCIPMSAIAGGQPRGQSRLLLFMRDRRLVAADLEKACSARDFYSGFYVDKQSGDAQLCTGRDRILARNGARCRISSFKLLVADD